MTNGKYSIFDKMIEGVQIIDPQWRYLYVNDTLAGQSKYSREELLGRTMMEMYPGIDQTELFGFLRECMEHQTAHQMINSFDFPDGSKGYFELRIQAVPEGILILSFDVTKQKRAEQYLLDTNMILDEKVRQRTTELEAKNKELEQFTYIASHDLQEPLRTVSNYIQVLKEDYKSLLDDTAMSYLNAMKRGIERMQMLTKALLNFAQLGRNKTLQPIDTTKIVEEVLADLKNMITSSEASIKLQNLPALKGYETELRQLFQNLISNAIKFRHPERKPEIRIGATEQEQQWLFSVGDNGIGIADTHYERIFNIFQRLHKTDEYEGDGIGLANCKKIVELHGGSISVSSKPDVGSTFTFSISKL